MIRKKYILQKKIYVFYIQDGELFDAFSSNI